MSNNQDKKVSENYQTKDYNRFKKTSENRIIDPLQVKKLKASMEIYGWAKGSVIQVNEKNEIIDGQHRFYAAQQIGIPILYSISKGSGEMEIQILNQNQKNWNKVNFVDFWANKGNLNYQAVKEFGNRNPKLKITQHLMLLMNEPHAHPDTNMFQSGDFKVASIEKAQLVADCLEQVEPFFPKNCYQSKFVAAMIKVILKKKVFKFSKFIKKLEKNRNLLYPCTTADAYIERFQEIYNYYTPNDEKVDLFH